MVFGWNNGSPNNQTETGYGLRSGFAPWPKKPPKFRLEPVGEGRFKLMRV